MDPVLIATLGTKAVEFVLAMIDAGQITDEDLASLDAAVAKRKKAKEEWDALNPDNPETGG